MPIPNYTFRLLLFGWLLAQSCLAHSQDPTPVVAVSPSISSAENEIHLSGSLVAARQANLSTQVDGTVAQVLVDAGSHVEQGDLLLTLDPRLEQHELERLGATLRSTQATVDENQRLVDEAIRLSKDNHIPKNELAARKATLASSQALLESIKAEKNAQQQRLAWHQLHAPFAGVITQKVTETGEWVTRGTPVFQLVDTEHLYLDVQVPQEAFSQLEKDPQVTISPGTDPNTTLMAEIAAVIPVAEGVSRSFRVRLKTQEPHPSLLAGASATAIFSLNDANASVLKVPRDAILRNPDGGFSVYTVEQKDSLLFARRHRVTLGLTSGAQVVVTSGLTAESRVVIRGNEILRNDQPVTIVEQ